jgi:hypothetical protein
MMIMIAAIIHTHAMIIQVGHESISSCQCLAGARTVPGLGVGRRNRRCRAAPRAAAVTVILIVYVIQLFKLNNITSYGPYGSNMLPFKSAILISRASRRASRGRSPGGPNVRYGMAGCMYGCIPFVKSWGDICKSWLR